MHARLSLRHAYASLSIRIYLDQLSCSPIELFIGRERQPAILAENHVIYVITQVIIYYCSSSTQVEMKNKHYIRSLTSTM